MGFSHPSAPELSKDLPLLPFNEYLIENFGNYVRKLGLAISDPATFEFRFKTLTIDRLSHPLLDDLHSSIFLLPINSFYSEKEERSKEFRLDFDTNVSPNNIG